MGKKMDLIKQAAAKRKKWLAMKAAFDKGKTYSGKALSAKEVELARKEYFTFRDRNKLGKSVAAFMKTQAEKEKQAKREAAKVKPPGKPSAGITGKLLTSKERRQTLAAQMVDEFVNSSLEDKDAFREAALTAGLFKGEEAATSGYSNFKKAYGEDKLTEYDRAMINQYINRTVTIRQELAAQYSVEEARPKAYQATEDAVRSSKYPYMTLARDMALEADPTIEALISQEGFTSGGGGRGGGGRGGGGATADAVANLLEQLQGWFPDDQEIAEATVLVSKGAGEVDLRKWVRNLPAFQGRYKFIPDWMDIRDYDSAAMGLAQIWGKFFPDRLRQWATDSNSFYEDLQKMFNGEQPYLANRTATAIPWPEYTQIGQEHPEWVEPGQILNLPGNLYA